MTLNVRSAAGKVVAIILFVTTDLTRSGTAAILAFSMAVFAPLTATAPIALLAPVTATVHDLNPSTYIKPRRC